jgi:Domain of unknown function (DUF4760)
MTAADWTALAAWVAAVLAGGGAALVIFQLYLAQRTTRDEYENRKRQAAIEFYARTINQRGQWNLKLPPDRDEEAIKVLVGQALDPDGEQTEEARRTIYNYLGFWELLSAGVSQNVLDRATIRSLARGRAVAVWKNYEPFVTAERHRYDAPMLYIELQHLAESLAADH